jgi:tyrosyl-tRNA synthetase
VNELIKKDAISKRLTSDTGISYTEFAYPLLQGYDYYVLFQNHNCTVQVGGSDQWGNIVSGVELIRRKAQETVHAITVPLIIDKATGKKFGKSEGNAVWLQAEKTSPFMFYQFWLNQSDESVGDFLKLFTELPLSLIEDIMQSHTKEPGQRQAQQTLAAEVTSLVHGEATSTAVARVSKTIFSGEDLNQLSAAEQDILLENAPSYKISSEMSILDLLITTGLCESKRAARTFLTDNAISLDGEKITDEGVVVSPNTALRTLRRGKKNYIVLY